VLDRLGVTVADGRDEAAIAGVAFALTGDLAE
jgi:hypothetical protein